MVKVSWVVNTSGMVNDIDRGKPSKTGQDRRRRSAQTGIAVMDHQRQHLKAKTGTDTLAQTNYHAPRCLSPSSKTSK